MPYDADTLTIDGLSASGLDQLLVPETDVRGYNWVSLSLNSSVYVGTLTPEFTFDPSDGSSWRSIQMYNMRSLDGGDASLVGFSATSTVGAGPVYFPWFRVRMSAYTSGEAQGSLLLSKTGPSALQLLTTYVRILPAKNDIGFINNYGNGSAAIAAGHAADTAVSLYPGMLSRILVTTAGTNEMVIYDNNAAASGTIIGIVPASTARGTWIECMAPVNTGIYVAGNANNPGVSIFFAS